MKRLYRTELFYIWKSNFGVAIFILAALLILLECLQNESISTLSTQSELRNVSFKAYADAVITKRMIDMFSDRSSVYIFTTFTSCGIIAYGYDCKKNNIYIQHGYQLSSVVKMQAVLVFILTILYTIISSACFTFFYSWYWKNTQLGELFFLAILRLLSVAVLSLALIIVTIALKTLVKSALALLIILFCSYNHLFSRISVTLGILFDLKHPLLAVQTQAWISIIALCTELLLIYLFIEIRQRFDNLS